MKTGKLLSMKVLVVAVVLALANQSHALVTPYMTALSNFTVYFVTTLTNPADQAEARAVNQALKDLAKPSASVAQDYNIFFSAAIHLGPFVLQEPFGSGGSNVFALFLNDAAGEMGGGAGGGQT